MKAMRGHAEVKEDGSIKSGGEILFYWTGSGPHLILYREWEGQAFQPGEEREVFWLHDVAW